MEFGLKFDLANISRHISFKSLFFTLCGLAIVKYRKSLYWPIYSWQTPLRHLNGPKNDSFFFGHFIRIANQPSSTLYEGWAEKYGKTFKLRGFLGSTQLYTTDAKAIHHVLTHPGTFQRLEAAKLGTEMIVGKGLLTADLETHKKQRRIMNPAFGALQIRHLVPIFIEKSNRLRDAWLEIINNNPDGAEIEVISWLGRATLDMIGSAGFGYEFNSIDREGENELAKAFKKIFNFDKDITTMMLVEATLHYFFRFPTKGTRELNASLATMHRIGKELIADKRNMIQCDSKNNTELQGRDLLTLLIKSNITAQEEGSHENQSMSDEEVLGQISTFIVAGHETSGSTTAWALYALTQYPEVQTRLRHELQTSGLGDEPSMSELDKLPYLDAFVRETLRLHSVVPTIIRETTADVVIPTGEEFKDRNGMVCKEIRMQKGDAVWIPLLPMNRAKDVWGEDAMEFRPERWYDLPETVNEVPGIWGNVMTFSLGTHSCIGFRFAVIEIKALIYSLVRSIEFTINSELEIEAKAGAISVRPCVKSSSKENNQLPLKCRPAASL